MITQHEPNVHSALFNFKKHKEIDVVFMSDIHFDSKKCDRVKFFNDLDEAKEAGALVFIFGDFFDCMGGTYDPRSSKGDLRPEYVKHNYFDEIVKDAAEKLAPYKDTIKFISYGNHETSIVKRQEIDLIDRLVFMLNNMYGFECAKGQYAGYLRFQFGYGNGAKYKSTIFYTHGDGGSAVVTGGAINMNRRQVWVDADIMVSGHLHKKLIMDYTRIELSTQNKIKEKVTQHIQLQSYKEHSITSLGQGWEVQRGFSPTSRGCTWLKFYVHNHELFYKITV